MKIGFVCVLEIPEPSWSPCRKRFLHFSENIVRRRFNLWSAGFEILLGEVFSKIFSSGKNAIKRGKQSTWSCLRIKCLFHVWWISRNVKSSLYSSSAESVKLFMIFCFKIYVSTLFSPEYRHYTRRNILLQFSWPNSPPLQFLSTLLSTDFDRRTSVQQAKRGL